MSNANALLAVPSIAPPTATAAPPAAAPAAPALQAGHVLLQLRDVESIIGQLQQLRTLIPELQSKVAVSQLALAEAEARLKAREKERKEQGIQTVDSVQVVDKEMLEQQAHTVEQQRRLLEERVRALNAATSHTDTLASELIHYQRLFAYVIVCSSALFNVLFIMSSFAFSLFRSTSEESLKQLQNANAAQQQMADSAMMERDALSAELKQGNGRGVPMTPVVPLRLTFLFRFPPAHYRNCEALRGKCQSGTGQEL
jgi:vacuolar-type H+-ATPase subunit I/STV1